MDTEHERLRTLAFARLLGHLLSDGSISVLGQGRMQRRTGIDRETVLDDVELLTGSRPTATRYDERKWTIVLPKPFTDAIITLPVCALDGAFSKLQHCQHSCWMSLPGAVVREFLGGLFGADGHGPTLHRWGKARMTPRSSLPPIPRAPHQSMSMRLKAMMADVIRLLGTLWRQDRRREASTSIPHAARHPLTPAAQDGIPRIEVRLELPDGL